MKHNSLIGLLVLLAACSQKEPADLLIYDSVIYPVDDSFSVVDALVVRDGKVIETGTTETLKAKYDAKESINGKGKFVYPGFIDAHAHFTGYGNSLQEVNLVGTGSWEEVLERAKKFSDTHTTGWLTGLGWDQNDWAIKEFPANDKLNELFPDRPVFLSRIDGHAAIVNQKALDMAGIRAGDQLTGGQIETRNGKLTGILIDNAIERVSSRIPGGNDQQKERELLDAQRECFAVGLTTVDDCGLDFETVLFIDNLQQKGKLKMRIYAMLSDARKNFDFVFSRGKIKTDRLNVRSFKVYADGALGSRGACLLQPYTDKPGWSGFLLSTPGHFDSVANIIRQKGFQMCTHAIGDSGNRIILNIYGKYLEGKNDLRWRIEHAQVINANDFDLFGKYNIIPSVQPTHATSDMYWAEKRLGPERVKGAYAYQSLLKQNGWIPLGTDFPVEDISPFKTYYAAVIRKDAKGWPAEGFQTENELTRQQALRGMTIWAARSNFEESEKGSLEKGKFADFVILDTDLIHATPEQLLQARVVSTYLNGEKVYDRK